MKILLMIFLLGAVPVGATPRYHPPSPTITTFPSGMKIFVLEDPEFPVVELTLYLTGGSVFDPPGKEGRASLALTSLRYGGTTSRSAEKIEEELDQMGATLQVQMGEEFGTLTLRLLKKDLNQGLEILFDLLQHPVFQPEKLKILQEQFRENLLREREEPVWLAFREFSKKVYSKSPWGRTPTPQSVSRLRREELIEYYQKEIGPDRLLGAVSGDFSTLEIMRELKIRSANWKPTGQPSPVYPDLNSRWEPGRWWIEKKGLTQSTLVVGHLGSRRENPDKYPLLLLNYILGGSGALTSRLGERVRVEGGQAYSVASSFGFSRVEGLFWAFAQTETSQTSEVLELLLKTLGEMAEKPTLSEEELRRAKQAILRSLFFDYETPQAILRDLVKFSLWGYPENYLEIFQERIDSLTREEVERVASYLRPKDLKILVVGSPDVKKELPSIGKFKRTQP